MKRGKMNRGFTLVEIMIVVAIIGLLAAIAVPNFVNARNQSRISVCINNLRQIDSAKEQYALQENLNDGDAIADPDTGFTNYIRGGFANLRCPIMTAGGDTSYEVNVVGTPPDCKSPEGAGGNGTHVL